MTEALDLLSSLTLPGGERWGEVAAPWQWDDASAILDLDSTTPYSICTRPRGGSKTTDAGALALVTMVTQLPPGSRSYGLASDRDQGRLIVDSVAGFVRDTPSITRDFEIGTWRVTHLPSGSTFDVLSADASGSWGLRPSFVIIDELAQWAETSGPKTLWEAVVTSAAKDSSARLMVITSAGDQLTSAIASSNTPRTTRCGG